MFKKTIEDFVILVCFFTVASFISFYIVGKTASPEVVPFDGSRDNSLESISEEGLHSEVALDGTGEDSLELPQLSSEKEKIGKGQVKSISAYNVGDVNQCSGDPCISASGANICGLLDDGVKLGVCAANWVSFGTVIEIEDVGKCVVLDRMNSRFSQHVDWAFRLDEKQEALDFGRRDLRVWVIN